MDTQSLKAFLAVARSGSFSDAATGLHLTQPAVSKRIAALEKAVGATLFDRAARKIVLTPAGHTLLPHAESVLAQLGEARRAILDLDGRVRGPLRIAISHHLGLHKLPPLMRAFKQGHPEVDLSVQFLDSEVAHAAVMSRECELAVVTLAPVAPEGLLLEPLWRDRLQFTAAANSPAANLTTLAELSRHPAILPDERTFTGRLVAAQFAKAGLDLPRAMTTNYLETIKTMVEVGLGWSVLPESLCSATLVALPVSATHLSRELGLVRHRSRQLSNAARAFAAHLRTEKDAEYH